MHKYKVIKLKEKEKDPFNNIQVEIKEKIKPRKSKKKETKLWNKFKEKFSDSVGLVNEIKRAISEELKKY